MDRANRGTVRLVSFQPLYAKRNRLIRATVDCRMRAGKRRAGKKFKIGVRVAKQ